MGRTLIFIGILSVIAGLLILAFPKLFSWFGQLPGDIRIERENTRIYIPLVSMILISVILTISYYLFFWILQFISKLK